MTGTKNVGMSEGRLQELRDQREALAGSAYGEGFEAGSRYATAEGEDGASLEELLWFERIAPACADWRLAIARERHGITDRYGEPERFPAEFWRGFAEGLLSVWRQHRDAVLRD